MLLIVDLIYRFTSLGNVFLLLPLLFLLHYLMVLYEFRNMPPGPRFTALPVLGNIFSLKFRADKLSDRFRSLRQNYGGVSSLRIGSHKLVMASTPEAVKEILVTRSADFAGRQRTYSLKERTLEQQGKHFDPADCLQRSVADVICGITFHEGSDTTNPDINRLLKLNVHRFSSTKDYQLVVLLDFFHFAKYLPLKVYDRVHQNCYEIFNIIRKLMTERNKSFDPTEPVGDFMSALLRARSDFRTECVSDEERAALLSDDYFVSCMEDMFVGGYETTSTALRWIMSFLAQHPQYQMDMQNQMDEAVGDRRPSLNDRPNLPLVQAAILEALRLGNVVPLAVPHVAVTDTILCGYRVPKDTIVFADTESVHLDPKCWEDPTLFNPYRYIDADGELMTNQGNFYPFGAGRRVCAGESLAKIELFLFVALLVHNFTFIAGEGHPPKAKASITQFPTSYTIRVIPRR
ncbi:unnamed protein product [Porites evermanni]|uniref:Uncharacterized protein n=1 Tax=Porites evermanni TaxID=104178 RepID=A0ABN8Q0B0_9CNID|nr:unnamed protein product [Porites evermanni]